MAYIKTTWEDGENKYSITDQSGNVIPGFEDIKLLYTGTGGTPLSQEKMNNIEDGLSGVISESYQTNAEQNIQLWELEAQVIQDKENMSAWQGDGFFPNQSELAVLSNVLITRSARTKDGYANFANANFDTPITLPTPASYPSSGQSVAFSPDDLLCAVTVNSTGFFVYKHNGDTFTRSVDPDILPAGSGYDVTWSSDGKYLAVAHSNSPFVTIYKRDGFKLTKLPGPSVLPTNNGKGVSFSPNAEFLAVHHPNTSPCITIYKRSGDTFTKLPNPSVLPVAGSSYSDPIAFSSDGQYLAVGNATDKLLIYKRSGDTFTKLTFTVPGSYVYGISWSPDGSHLAVSHISSPFVTIYKREGDTFTKLANPATLPQTGQCVTYSPDGLYLVIGNLASSYLFFYKRSGDTYTSVYPAVTHSQGMLKLAFSRDGAYLVGVFSSASPGIVIYKASDYFKTATSGSLTLKRRTLPEVSNSVFILDEVALDAGVRRAYDISLDGGVTWEEVTITGEVVTLGHSGTELIIKLKLTRSVSGVGEGKVYWIAAWAGVV